MPTDSDVLLEALVMQLPAVFVEQQSTRLVEWGLLLIAINAYGFACQDT